MDEASVRAAVTEHVRAIMEGRVEDALAHVLPDIQPEVRANLPWVGERLKAVEIGEVRIREDEAVVHLRFITIEPGQSEVRIESTWWEIDGRPLLVETSVEGE